MDKHASNLTEYAKMVKKMSVGSCADGRTMTPAEQALVAKQNRKTTRA